MPDDQAPKPNDNQPSFDDKPLQPQNSPFSAPRQESGASFGSSASDFSAYTSSEPADQAIKPETGFAPASTPMPSHTFSQQQTDTTAPSYAPEQSDPQSGSANVSSFGMESTESTTPSVEPSPFGPASAPVSPVQNPSTTPTSLTPQFAAQPPLSTASGGGSKKKFIVIGAVIAAALVLLGGGVATYALWYQNPQKILGDGLASVMSARAVGGTVSYESTEPSGMKVKVTFDAATKDSNSNINVDATITNQGKDLNLKGSGISDKDGNLYFKLAGIPKALEIMYAGAPLPEAYTQLATKYDDKWIKVSADDLKETGESNEKSKKCFDAFEKVTQGSQFKNDFSSTYQKNQFIVIKDDLGTKDGNFGYVVDVDKTISKKFGEDFKTTESFKTLKADCPDLDDSTSDSTVDDSSDDSDKPKVSLWISQFGHQLNKLEVNSNSTLSRTKMDIAMNIKHDQPADIKAPGDTVSIKDLMKDVQAAEQSYMQQYTAQYSNPTYSGEGGGNSSMYQSDSLSTTLFDILKGQ